jgi:DNA-binding CsgD family transcriptional regulator
MIATAPKPCLDSLNSATALAESRVNPGVLVVTPSLGVLYMNAEARELTRAMNQTPNGRKATGVLPLEITKFCEELLRLMQVRTGPQSWENAQLRRVMGNAKCFMILRGFGIPAMAGVHEAHLIVTIEEITNRREVTAERAKERFHLTDREQTVIIYLLKGLTNKEIASRLMITEQTVKEHLKHIMHKTNVTTRTGVLAQILLTPSGMSHAVQMDAAQSKALQA